MRCVVIALLWVGLAFSEPPSKILLVFAYGGTSHMIYLNSLLHVLKESGKYDLTVITTQTQGNQSEMYREILIPPNNKEWLGKFVYHLSTISTPWEERRDMWDLALKTLQPFWELVEVKDIINSRPKFDLIITESVFVQETTSYFRYLLNAPLISVSTKFSDQMGNYFSDNYINPGALPEPGSFFSNTMTFWERLYNTYSWASHTYDMKYVYLPMQEAAFKKAFNIEVPPINEAMSSIDLHFLNSDPMVTYPLPNGHNVIEIPGLHIKPPKPLPKDLESMMLRSKHGVIVVSFGSLMPISSLPQEKVESFIEAFKTLNQTIIWKSDIGFKDLPSNVFVRKWLPQQSILAHPNCVGLMTHGGMLSKQEAVYFGRPVVTVPFFGDQFYNAKHSEVSGFGIALSFSNITKDSVEWALKTIVNQPQYKLKAERASEVFQESVSVSAGKVLYWVKYMIKLQSGSHLHPATSHLTFFQTKMWDICLFLIANILIIACLVLKVVKFCLRSKKTRDEPIKSKMN